MSVSSPIVVSRSRARTSNGATCSQRRTGAAREVREPAPAVQAPGSRTISSTRPTAVHGRWANERWHPLHSRAASTWHGAPGRLQGGFKRDSERWLRKTCAWTPLSAAAATDVDAIVVAATASLVVCAVLMACADLVCCTQPAARKSDRSLLALWCTSWRRVSTRKGRPD